MNARNFKNLFSRGVAIIVFLAASFLTASAQDDAALENAFINGMALIEKGQFAEAIPHMAVLVKAMPDDANLRLVYGVGLLTKSKQIDDLAEAKKLSAEALEQFLAAKRLGVKSAELDSFIKLLGGGPPTDTKTGPQPKLSEAEKHLEQAEMFFAQSKYDESLVYYHKALAADPKLYSAALHAGDAYVAKQDWENAEKFYQKAIAIDSLIETAYRYSATPLMRQKKFDQARDRYIEAYITEPYSQMSPRGIGQWADATNARLGHPEIEFPKSPLPAPGEAKDASSVWQVYFGVRDDWKKSKFRAAFPGEKSYRHSLREEAEAIRAALLSAKEKKIKDARFELLQKIEDDGLLEAFILMAVPDQGIAQDHEGYLKDHRASLRQYVLKYVIRK